MSEATTTELLEVIRQLQSQVEQLTQRIQELEAENKALREENTRLKKRISDLVDDQWQEYSYFHLSHMRINVLQSEDYEDNLVKGISAFIGLVTRSCAEHEQERRLLG